MSDRCNEQEGSRRVALITGASGGIGVACVRHFLNSGWRVAATALPGPDLDRLSGRDVLVIPGDLTFDRARWNIVEGTLANFGRIDVLVNSAGAGLYGPPSSVSIDLTRRLFELNVLAPLAMAQLVIPAMRRLGSGTIVNLGSVGGYVSLPWAVSYSASKFALHALNDALRRELREDHIHVVNMAPGIVDTAFRANVLGGAAPARVANIRWVVSPEAVAKGILNGIMKRRRTVYVPKVARLFRLLDFLAPRVMDWYTGLFLAPPAASCAPKTIGDFAVEPAQVGTAPARQSYEDCQVGDTRPAGFPW